MYQVGEKLKVPILLVQDGEANKSYAFGEVLGKSESVTEATELKVELGEGRFTVANIKNTDLEELND